MEQTITCPSCGKSFLIRNESTKEKVTIKCPFCRNDIEVHFRPHPIHLAQNNPIEPFNGQQFREAEEKPRDTHATTFGASLVKGTPVLIVNGASYKLSMGRNTVGRKSASSTATLQLPTDDQHMSRTNAVIEVSQTTQGEWHVLLSSVNERNLVRVNRNVIEIGDRVLLQAGYVLTLGHTQLVFNFE